MSKHILSINNTLLNGSNRSSNNHISRILVALVASSGQKHPKAAKAAAVGIATRGHW